MNIQGNLDINFGGTIHIVLSTNEPTTIRPFIFLSYEGLIVELEGHKVAYTLPADKQIHVAVAYVDDHDNPARVDGPVRWSTSDENILSVETWEPEARDTPVGVPENGFATISVVGPVGQAQVAATADVDMGTGVKELVTLLDVTVVAGEAVAGTITPIGDPEPVA